MNRKLLLRVIFLLGLSLTGIILVQIFWFRNAIRIKEEQFNSNVTKALLATVEQIQIMESLDEISGKIADPGSDSLSIFITAEGSDLTHHSEQNITILSKQSSDHSYSYHSMTDGQSGDTAFPDFSWNMIRVKDSTFLIDMEEKGVIKLDTLSTDQHNNIVFIRKLDVTNDSLYVYIDHQIKKINTKKAQLEKVFEKMVVEVATVNKPVEQKINGEQIRVELGKALSNHGITLPFEFAVLESKEEHDRFPIRSEGFSEEVWNGQYKVDLFPNEPFQTPHFLTVYFHGKQYELFRSVAWLLTGSLLLTLLILLTFFLTITLIFRQKKVSEIKSDFINNMTHEFKTPIATISLAADSMANEKVLSQREQSLYFLRIIKEESKRMNSQVERILQMALLDKKDFDLTLEVGDVHDLIREAATSIRLQVEKKGGSLSLDLKSDQVHVLTDRVHFTNVIYNLLDNAIKYSENAPVISISTENGPNGIAIIVADQGIGMSHAVKARIFDKFYRQTTGNIHTIKGFGLGLSYVKAIITLHKGTIRVESEPGKGSRFILWLPVIE